MKPAAEAVAEVLPRIDGLPALRRGDRVHLVGVGGAGMSGLARALLSLGLEVSGSDRQASKLLTQLAAEGVRVQLGHRADGLPADCSLLVHTPAVGAENPELAAALERGIPVTKRAVILGALMEDRIGIAIAGTHGKTTTSGLLACILEDLGLEPSYFVGGELPDLGSNARLAAGAHLVLEADEYDHSFLQGRPQLAVITNLEHDHPDIYPDLASLVAAFSSFARGLHPAPEGCLIVNAAWPLALEAAEGTTARVLTYHVEGDAAAAPDRPLDWRATELQAGAEGTRFRLRQGAKDLGVFHLGLPGRHNVGNALAAIAVAHELGIEAAALQPTLDRYRGAGRRFQPAGSFAGIDLIDDYAHHPTEIRATLEAARERFPGRRLIALVEPHTYSRVALLHEDFRAAIAGADIALVAPIYAARETPMPGIDSDLLVAGLPHAESLPSLELAAQRALALAVPGDLLIFLGAGRIQDASASCLRGLREKAIHRLLDAAEQRGLGGTRLPRASLAEHTSIKVGGPADLMLRVGRIEDLEGWWCLAQELEIPVRVLGRGSNVLASDSGFQGLVILNRCEAWSIEAEHSEGALVVAESGLTLASLAQSLARQGLAGIEMGVGIPGSVGAAVVTNAGAHGWEMKDSLLEIEVLDAAGRRERLGPEALGFRYRGSLLKDAADRLVLRVGLTCQRDDSAAILERISRYSQHRRSTQPREPSLGSVFENPEGDHAGRLIEAVGLKGRRLGGAQISPLHANFIINRDSATAAEVLALINLARQTVQAQEGRTLRTEIEIIGATDAS